MNLFGSTIQSLENSMNYSTAKNRAISNNIANVDTPGYKAKDVVFKDMLSAEMSSIPTKRTNTRHIDFQSRTGTSSFQTITVQNSTYNHNGNNVDIDKEMNELAQNQIQYQALTSRISSKFQGLERVLRGGN
ncbi:flagellar basal body rod protein FlgB [Halobacillus locisalis]|uniref:Flagellar basal body rod protein FlgB n=1 Tax=Halobacillus locisalis TaxID=220753 RepID=A0A838CQG0_9BACI|nr:flagellar basal body rod protein FlgB [Halobacillus locisalis]MBA2174118.1 flagellar basal body rod protein FlgB [Halobacillus locisalis]